VFAQEILAHHIAVAAMPPKALCQPFLETGITTVLEPPVPRLGARRVWSDSRGGL
jgi:hypothetical protein